MLVAFHSGRNHHTQGFGIDASGRGRISIGRVVEKNGKRLPEKDDEFTITSQVQGRDGWINHPLDEQLRKDKAPSCAAFRCGCCLTILI